uniref:E3 ubiquitin-protein ligase n=1 Tax=Caenorhabditis tropicalis TaxID=1561998 RepID=A0A1I7TK99_9PELO
MISDLIQAAGQGQWAQVRQLLLKHWLVQVPQVFEINPDMPWDNSLVNERLLGAQGEILFSPIVSAFSLTTNNGSTLEKMNEIAGVDPAKRGQICGHVFKNGELTYTCLDCATDGTCVMCLSCFEVSIHKSHKYRMHSSSGSGYCDCGDIDAWTDGYACANHEKKGEVETATLAPELKERCEQLVEIILHFSLSMITHKDDSNLPELFDSIPLESPSETPQCLTVLYNDETHTYESVIKVLELYIHCTKDQAMLVATIVDREGRSAVKQGSKAECTKAKDDVQKKTSRDTTSLRRTSAHHMPLSVKVMDTTVFTLQNFSISLLTWLNAQMDVFPPLREIVGEIILSSKFPLKKNYSYKSKPTEILFAEIERNVQEAIEVDDEEPELFEFAMREGMEDEELVNERDQMLMMMEVDREDVEAVTKTNAEQPQASARESLTFSILENILLQDTQMWKAGRCILHQLLMRSVFMIYDQKVCFAKTFMEHYNEIYYDFIKDDHDMDVSVVGLSVQFMTVPSLARKLVAEDEGFSVISKAIRQHTDKYIKIKSDERVARFDFTSRSFPADLRRALHITRDMAYILNAVPAESDWTRELIDGFLKGFADFLMFIKHLQGMDEVKRQAVEHQVWESEWETAFNILLRLKDAISLVISWAETNEEVHNKVLLMCLELMEQTPPVYTKSDEDSYELTVTINGESCKITHFDVLKSATSVHQPIVRIIAGLFTAHEHVRFLLDDKHGDEIQEQIKSILRRNEETNLYELSLRVLVLCAQLNASLWRRNGFSLINQIHNYFSPLCRNEMFDRDVLMMQVGAAMTPPHKFLIHLLHRFRLNKWATVEFEQDKAAVAQIKPESEDLSKTLVTIAEEFFQCLILILCERYTHGVGKTNAMEGLKREVIHILCTGSHTFSHIQQKVSNDNNSKRISLHDAVNQVADFRKPLSTSAGQFHCKESSLPVYSPFFMHFSKSDQSAAEQNQARVRAKLDKNIRACAPPPLPDFLPLFEKIPSILTSNVLIHIFRLVINRTTRRSRFSSDRLFHKVLYLIGIALNEEEKDVSFGFTQKAEGMIGLLSLLEGLVGKQESSICPILLEVTVEKYRKLMNAKVGSSEKATCGEQKPEQSAAEMKAKRAARAAEMRQKAMAKISNMQTKFMKRIEDDEKKDDIQTSTERSDIGNKNEAYDNKHFSDEDIVKQIGHDFPVCIGINKWQTEIVKPRTLTCILCQEDEIIAPQQGKPMVCAAFIQQSQLFTHKNQNGELLTTSNGTISTRDLLTAPATLQYGVDVSTCSHSMHHECYRSLWESNRSRDSLRARQVGQHSQKMVDAESGEYQCPLCKRLSNAAIPILPAYQLTNQNGFSTVSGATKETFETWISRIKRSLDMPLSSESVSNKGHSRKRSHSERSLLDLEKLSQNNKEPDSSSHFSGVLSYSAAHSDVSSSAQLPMSTGSESQTPLNLSPTQVDVEFYNELAALFVDQEANNVTSPTASSSSNSGSAPRNTDPTSSETSKKPLSSQIQHALYTLIRPFPTLISSSRICPPSLEGYEESIKDLGKNMIKNGRRGNEVKTNFLEKHLKGYVISTVTWQSTAHVARAISSYLHYDKKPLFGALNTRQRDCLSAMGRLCATLSHNMQYLLHAVSDMLRVLLCEPPKPKLTQTASSPLLGTSPPSSSQSSLPHSGTNFAFFVQLFNPAGPRKNVNLNILQVDILSLAISLMMTIGWTWNNGIQSMSSSTHPKTRLLTPDGSVDEGYVLRLSLLAHYFQIVATHSESDGEDVRMADDEESSHNLNSVEAQIVTKLYSICHPDDVPLKHVDALWKKLEEGAQSLLRPIALLYHFITLVDPPEALKDPSINSSEVLFRYLGLPQKIEDQINGTLVETLFTMWSTSIPKDSTLRRDLVVQPVRPNLLVDLPERYSQLINQVASFKCPTIPIEESTSNVPTLCLVCGTILCSQAYCCQKIINKKSLGACRYHMSQCSGSVGMFLRVRDCSLVLMTTRQRGCFRPAPYVDEFGEVDQGFRRGNPLHLNTELYQKLKSLWLQQGITEEVVNYNEIDYRNVQYDWAHF